MKRLERFAGLLLILFVIAACGQQAQEAAMEEEEPAATETEMETTSAVRQAYPNLTSNVVFENDQLIAQHVTAEPGVWAGEITQRRSDRG
ncbi:MAG: hypothetical protein P8Y29_11880, partial [Gemmatimonadota bacterium]